MNGKEQIGLPGLGKGIQDAINEQKRPKVPGSGRVAGTPNKMQKLTIGDVYTAFSKEAEMQIDEIPASRFLLCVMHNKPKLIGLPETEKIPIDLRIDAATQLLKHELPKKKAIEVEISGANGSFVISSGPSVPENETNEQQIRRAEIESQEAEIENKKRELEEIQRKELEAQNELNLK